MRLQSLAARDNYLMLEVLVFWKPVVQTTSIFAATFYLIKAKSKNSITQERLFQDRTEHVINKDSQQQTTNLIATAQFGSPLCWWK